MLKEKQRAKVLDDAQQQQQSSSAHAQYDTPRRRPSDTPARQTATVLPPAASPSVNRPAVPVRQDLNKPEPLTAAMEALKINQMEVGDKAGKWYIFWQVKWASLKW